MTIKSYASCKVFDFTFMVLCFRIKTRPTSYRASRRESTEANLGTSSEASVRLSSKAAC